MSDIRTYNGGRLGNQLYYALQAYINNCKYKVNFLQKTSTAIQQYNLLKNFGCSDLICLDGDALYTNDYCQCIDKNFSLDQLNSFIDNIVLKSNIISNGERDSTSLYICIRNGDFINTHLAQKIHSPFNRNLFLKRSIQAAVNCNANIKCIKIVSDNISICREYDSLFLRYFDEDNIEYVNNSGKNKVLQDFRLLCLAKHKIIFNSTFHYWSSFISNRIFRNSEKCIWCRNLFYVDPKTNSIVYAYDRVNPKWNIIKVI